MHKMKQTDQSITSMQFGHWTPFPRRGKVCMLVIDWSVCLFALSVRSRAATHNPALLSFPVTDWPERSEGMKARQDCVLRHYV